MSYSAVLAAHATKPTGHRAHQLSGHRTKSVRRHRNDDPVIQETNLHGKCSAELTESVDQMLDEIDASLAENTENPS